MRGGRTHGRYVLNIGNGPTVENEDAASELASGPKSNKVAIHDGCGPQTSGSARGGNFNLPASHEKLQSAN